MKSDDGKRMVFGDFVDRVFWAVLTGIGGFGVVQMNGLSENISKLNSTMATVVTENGDIKRRVDNIEEWKEYLTRNVPKSTERSSK